MMKKNYGLGLLLVITLFFFLIPSGCGNGGSSDNDHSEPQIEISGTVRSVSTYDPIVSADVQIGNASTVTDAQGYFTFTMTADDMDMIRIAKDGYVSFQKTLQDYPGDTIELESFLMPVNVVQTINPAATEGNTLTTADGAAVTIPQLSGISENLIVSLTSFNASTGDLQAVSGNFSTLDENQNETELSSLGIIHVAVQGETTGDKYTLDGLDAYEIRIPISGEVSTAPDTIALWYFDEDLNAWVEQGSAVRSGDLYVGTVNHFSFWQVANIPAGPGPASFGVYQGTYEYKAYNGGCEGWYFFGRYGGDVELRVDQWGDGVLWWDNASDGKLEYIYREYFYSSWVGPGILWIEMDTLFGQPHYLIFTLPSDGIFDAPCGQASEEWVFELTKVN